MSRALPDAPLESILSALIDYRGKTPTKSSSGVKLITAKVIKGGRIEDGNHEFIAEADYVGWMRRGLPQQRDILITTEAPLGEVAMLRTAEKVALAQRVILLRANGRLADQDYLFHALKSPLVQARLYARGTGTTVLGIKQSELRQVEIPLPPLATQRRIALILSAYDDLIENNTRRIAILEEMARRIYAEWFVRFRLPGHEGVRMVESELGLVPAGWPIVRLDDVLVLQRGFDLPKQDRTEGPFPIISATGTSGSHHEYKVRGPGVVTGRSGSLGTLMYVEGDFWPLNTTLWVKRFVVGSPLYAFYVLQSIDLVGFNSGAAVPTLNRNDVHGLPVVRPAPDVLTAFDQVVGPMIRLKRRLELANANLHATRNLLLPKLISGELDVSAMPEPEALAA